jgi:hypothetical protein
MIVRYAYVGIKANQNIGAKKGKVKIKPRNTIPNVVVSNHLLGHDFQNGILLVLMT